MNEEEGDGFSPIVKYGGILLILVIFSGIVYFANDEVKINNGMNKTEVESFLEDNTRYSDCSAEFLSYSQREEAHVECSSEIGVRENTSYFAGERYRAEKRNGSIYFFPMN